MAEVGCHPPEEWVHGRRPVPIIRIGVSDLVDDERVRANSSERWSQIDPCVPPLIVVNSAQVGMSEDSELKVLQEGSDHPGSEVEEGQVRELGDARCEQR